jgi:CHAT domain-containing protein/tetratricopeptide (TPR) repeat protein
MKKWIFLLFFIILGESEAQTVYFKALEKQYKEINERGNTDSLLLISLRMHDWAISNKNKYHQEYNKSLFYLGQSYEHNNKIELSKYYYNNFLKGVYKNKYKNIEYVDFLTHISNFDLKHNENLRSELNMRWALSITKDSIGLFTKKYAYCLNLFGVVSRNDDSSLNSYYKALDIYMGLGLNYESSIVLYNIGSRILDIGNYRKAGLYFDSSVNMFKKQDTFDTLELKDIHYDIALKYYAAEKYKEAFFHFNEALNMYLNIKKTDDSISIDIRNNLSYCCGFNNDFITGIKQQKAIHKYLLSRNMQNDSFYFDNFKNLCGAYYYAKKLDSCIACMHTLLDEIKAVRALNSSIIYDKLLILSEFYNEIGKFDTAITILINLKDSVLVHMPSNKQILFDIDHNLGLGYYEMGKYDISENIFLNLLKYLDKYANDVNKAAKIYNRLGLIYMEINNSEKSLKYLLKAHDLYHSNKSLVDSSEYALNLISLGVINCNSKNYQLSKEYYLQYVKLSKQNKDIEKANLNSIVFYNMAVLYDALDSFEQAEFYFVKCIEIENKTKTNHPSYAESLLGLGLFYFDNNRYPEAKLYYDSALNIIQRTLDNHHPLYLKALLRQAEYHIKFKYNKKAFVYYQDLHNSLTELVNNDFAWLSTEEKNAYWAKQKNIYKKIDYFFSTFSDSFTTASSIAYNVCLQTKSLLLQSSNQLNTLLVANKDSRIRELFQEMKTLRRQYNKTVSENININDSYKYAEKADSIDKVLTRTLSEYKNIKLKNNVTWKDVHKQLDTVTAAIEFSMVAGDLSRDKTYCAFVNRSKFEYPRRVILAQQQEIQLAIENNDFKSLYSLIWLKLEPLLFGIKVIYYSPVGELNNVAFSALSYGSVNQQSGLISNNTRGKPIMLFPDSEKKLGDSFLIDKYELHQLTTTKYLADINFNKSTRMETTICLVGGINYNIIPKRLPEKEKIIKTNTVVYANNIHRELLSQYSKNSKTTRIETEISYLPGTMQEINNIDSILSVHHWKTTVRTATDASEQQLKSDWSLQSSGIIHIATHGFSFPEVNEVDSESIKLQPKKLTYTFSSNPMVRSGLMLSGSNNSWSGSSQKMIEQTGEDGILTAAEVANMDLSNTKLVVLSACETGLGKIEGSEGTFGLKRGFKLAGVEQIIVSLWSVPDKETMELMTLFYTDLTKTLNPVVSFEKAQKEMRYKYPTEPEKWAGFVLVR